MQVVERLIKAERRVVHAIEEIALLVREAGEARAYAQKRTEVLKAAVSHFLVADPAKAYYLRKCLQRWQGVHSSLLELKRNTYVPEGQISHTVVHSDNDSE